MFGTAQEGQTLTASVTNGLSPFTYIWQSSNNGGTSWTDIGGATASTYTVAEADEGHVLRVDVTDFNGAPADSLATLPVIDVTPTLAVSVGGTAQEGQLLTASATLTTDSDNNSSDAAYQWQRSADNGMSWNNIGGATSGGYVPTTADVSDVLRAVASFTDDTGQQVTADSAPTGPVRGPLPGAVSVPGAQGSTIELQFATQQNTQLAVQLLDPIYAAYDAAPSRLQVQNAPTAPFQMPGELGLFALGDAGGVQNQGSNAAIVPTGYLGIVDAFTNAPATITGAPGQFDETVFSGQAGLTFYLNGGSGTVIAGGGNNVVAPGPNAPVTGGGWSILLDGGSNTVIGAPGNFFIDDGSSGAAGSNLIFLGSGNDTVQSWGRDTVNAGTGSDFVISKGPSLLVNGNSGSLLRGRRRYAERRYRAYYGCRRCRHRTTRF